MWIDSCNDVEGKMKILIFGMCNIGKSTVGEFLARKLGYDFIDMDAKIKEKYGTMLGFQDEYYMREIQADFDYFHTLYASKMDSISMDGKSLDGIVEDICKKYKLV